MYALRNLFENMHSQDMPADDIKAMIPDVKQDLNYTVGLMENLLNWAKSQMQSHSVKPHATNLQELIDDVVHILHLQADAKNIRIESKASKTMRGNVCGIRASLYLRQYRVNVAEEPVAYSARPCVPFGTKDCYCEVFDGLQEISHATIVGRLRERKLRS